MPTELNLLPHLRGSNSDLLSLLRIAVPKQRITSYLIKHDNVCYVNLGVSQSADCLLSAEELLLFHPPFAPGQCYSVGAGYRVKGMLCIQMLSGLSSGVLEYW